VEELDASISARLATVMRASGISELNPVEMKALPAILAGRNVLIVAPTGWGKTEAAMVPVLSSYLEERSGGISILYVTPLRALNRDIVKRLSSLGEALGISVGVRHGDTPSAERRRQALSPPEILVTTPETLQALLAGGRMRRHLSSVKCVVVDEVHSILGGKRGAQLAVALERLSLVAGEFQRIGLSATVENPRDAGRLICGDRPFEIQISKPPKEYRVSIEYPVPRAGDLELVDDLFSSPEAAARIRRIGELVRSHRSVLIFSNARTLVELLGHRLSKTLEAGVHHSSVSQEERRAMEDAFKDGRLPALVCTSTMELGIDVGFVDFVVQYLSPMTVSSFVQRFGRSGHGMGRVSEGAIICTNGEQVLESIAIARLFLEGRIERVDVQRNALDVLAHQLAGLAMDGLDLTVREAFEIIRRSFPYEGLDFEEFLEVVRFMEALGNLGEARGRLVKTGSTRRYYYENMSMIPDERRYPVVDSSSGGLIGTLGEEFVALHLSTGLDIICGGRVWRVLELREDGSVLVAPSTQGLGAIPGWDGELPPIPREVAERVAHLTRQMDLLGEGIEVDDEALAVVEEEISVARAEGVLPDPDEIVLEVFDRFLVLHDNLGTKINRTLLFLLRGLFEARGVHKVTGQCDAYRVMVEFDELADIRRVKEAFSRLVSMKDGEVDELLDSEVRVRSPFVLKHISARFGAIPRGIHLFDPRGKNLAERFRDTPIYKEALREGKREKLDVKGVKAILGGLLEGRMKARFVIRSPEDGLTQRAGIIVRRFSVLPELGVGTSRGEVHKVRDSILRKRMEVRCFECGEGGKVALRELDDSPRCPKCGSRFLTMPSGAEERLVLRMRASGQELKDRQVLSRLKWKADLLAIYGRRAAMALSIRGIGPQTASRILSRMYEDEDQFVAELLKAKGKYEATHQYWAA